VVANVPNVRKTRALGREVKSLKPPAVKLEFCHQRAEEKEKSKREKRCSNRPQGKFTWRFGRLG